MSVNDELLSRLVIRIFNLEDQDSARRLILSGLGEHFETIDPSLNPDLDDIAAAYTDKGHHFVVATIGLKIVGTGGLLIQKGREGRFVRLSVDSEVRGMGIGRAIVLKLLDMAIDQELSRIHAETNVDWYPAINLYRQCGFVETHSDDESIHLIRILE